MRPRHGRLSIVANCKRRRRRYRHAPKRTAKRPPVLSRSSGPFSTSCSAPGAAENANNGKYKERRMQGIICIIAGVGKCKELTNAGEMQGFETARNGKCKERKTQVRSALFRSFFHSRPIPSNSPCSSALDHRPWQFNPLSAAVRIR